MEHAHRHVTLLGGERGQRLGHPNASMLAAGAADGVVAPRRGVGPEACAAMAVMFASGSARPLSSWRLTPSSCTLMEVTVPLIVSLVFGSSPLTDLPIRFADDPI